MGGLRDGGSAGIAEPEQLRSLVEGLAGGIVAAGTELSVMPDPGADQQLRMAARDQQQQVGKIDAVGQPRGQRMGF